MTDKTTEPSFAEVWGEIIAKSWDDEEFKKRVIADPKAVMKEYGVEISEQMNVAVVEDTDVWVWPLPAKPTLSGEVGYCSSYFCCYTH